MDKARILIIDDDPHLRKTLADILSFKGFETLTANSGIEGLALQRENPVNLALIDIGLPDISGIEVLKKIKDDFPSIEVIILTGNASLGSAIEAANRDAFSYLVKPYDIEQLTLHIRRAIEKQQMERSLRESEERYRRLVDYAPDAILVHSNGIFLYANSAAMRLFGAASMEQLVGQPVISIVHPDYREIVSKRIQQLSESENPNGILEQKMMRFDGNTIDVEAVGIRISYQGKQAFQVIIRDITEKKLIQEALKEKVSLLEAALSKVKHLEGIIPICSYCKKIRDDKASWQQLESYITEHSEALFSHGTCPECAPKVNSEYMKELEKISPK